MLNLQSKRAWVFDLDGTLTKPVHDFAEIRRQLEVPPTADILDYLAALPRPVSEPLYERLHSIELDLAGRTEAAQGAVSCLSLLASSGVRLGILTRNSRTIARHTLNTLGLSAFFPPEQIFGRDEALPKPSPDGLHKLAAHWRICTDELVMVGDYLFDLQTGKTAGATTIHVDTTGTFSWPDLADLCVTTLHELEDLLLKKDFHETPAQL